MTDGQTLKKLGEKLVMRENITIITGSPGTGKSTIAKNVAELSYAKKSVLIHTDDFYHYLIKGAIPPHKKEASEQNRIVINVLLATVREFASNGFHVIVDGIIGPWFIDPWKDLANTGYKVNYFILRATKKETIKRAINRSKLTREENIELVEVMWNQFNNLGQYEKNVIISTELNINETAEKIIKNIDNQTFFL